MSDYRDEDQAAHVAEEVRSDTILTFEQPCPDSTTGETHDLTFDVLPDGRCLVTTETHGNRRQWMLSQIQVFELRVHFSGRQSHHA